MKHANIIFFVALLIGCSRQDDLGPPEIQYGQTDCSQCGMTVNDERYAAGLIVEASDGQRIAKVFDDIGCMIAYEHEQHDGTVLARYVKDFTTHQWLAAQQASYVLASSIHSPMSYGIAAAATRDAAEKLATTYEGKVLDDSGLRAMSQATASLK